MDRGYIKLWRKSLDSTMIQNAGLWQFWTWCLMKASHKPCKVFVGHQEIELFPGQFIFGRVKASTELGSTEKKVRLCLETLEKMENITVRRASKFSIISIVNWECYQEPDEQKGQQKGQQRASKGPAKGPSKGPANNLHESASTNDLQTLENSKWPSKGPATFVKKGHKQEEQEVIQTTSTFSHPQTNPDWLPSEMWDQFREHRKSMKSKMTPTAERLIMKKLEAFRSEGQSVEAILAQSIERGWKGVFAVSNGIVNQKPVVDPYANVPRFSE